MAVTYVTLYPPGGNSTTVQVVEGSQLHMIYADMGFSATPSAPGPPVRPDPFPQYVHDDEIGDLLADAAIPATDPVVASLVNDVGSETSVALSAALVPRDQTPAAEETPWALFKVESIGAGHGAFEITGSSFTNPGVGGAGTYNHGAWFGFNTGRFSGAPYNANAPSSIIGVEDNYYDDGGDNLFGPEFYWRVDPAGSGAGLNPLFRPFYGRASVSADGTTLRQAVIHFDIGTAGPNRYLAVYAGKTDAAIMSVFPTEVRYTKKLHIWPTTGGTPILQLSGLAPQIRFSNTVDINWVFWADPDDTTFHFDQNLGGTPHMTFTKGAGAVASLTDFASSVKVQGNVGFYGTTPIAKRTVTGSRGGNAALASLLTALAATGFLTDSSTA